MDFTVADQFRNMRIHFESAVTRPYAFRKKQLAALRDSLLQHEDEIYAALYADLKKSREEAYATELGLVLGELNLALRRLREWMEPITVPTDLVNFPSHSRIYKDPLGVVMIISPWNYPLQLLLNPLVGAIAGGNCAVIKPSEHAPATAALVTKIITGIFPAEYVFVLNGPGKETIPAALHAFRFDHLFYTGSTMVGRELYQLAAAQLVPVTLELGGKSPCIVEHDADIPLAAKRIILGKFSNAGQTCIAPDYILAHQSIKSQLIAEMKKAIEKCYTGTPATSPDYGRIIHRDQFRRLMKYMEDGQVVHGGAANEEDLFIEPTLLDNVSPQSPLMREEIFGPLLPVLAYQSTEEAMQIVKRNEQPLALYLFTANRKMMNEWIAQVPFGGGCINNTVWQFSNHLLPFGGVGKSGMGAYHGPYSFQAFTRLKPVLHTPNWFDAWLKYPPFAGRLKIFKWLIR